AARRAGAPGRSRSPGAGARGGAAAPRPITRAPRARPPPAIPPGLIARAGRVGAQRLALPLASVRAAAAGPRPGARGRRLVRAAIRLRAPDDALVPDGAFAVARLQAAGAARQVVRAAKSARFRRAPPPPYR